MPNFILLKSVQYIKVMVILKVYDAESFEFKFPRVRRHLNTNTVNFEIFGRARNHSKKFLKLSQTSLSGMVQLDFL